MVFLINLRVDENRNSTYEEHWPQRRAPDGRVFMVTIAAYLGAAVKVLESSL
jgi:hypothetical protein